MPRESVSVTSPSGIRAVRAPSSIWPMVTSCGGNHPQGQRLISPGTSARAALPAGARGRLETWSRSSKYQRGQLRVIPTSGTTYKTNIRRHDPLGARKPRQLPGGECDGISERTLGQTRQQAVIRGAGAPLGLPAREPTAWVVLADRDCLAIPCIMMCGCRPWASGQSTARG